MLPAGPLPVVFPADDYHRALLSAFSREIRHDLRIDIFADGPNIGTQGKDLAAGGHDGVRGNVVPDLQHHGPVGRDPLAVAVYDRRPGSDVEEAASLAEFLEHQDVERGVGVLVLVSLALTLLYGTEHLLDLRIGFLELDAELVRRFGDEKTS
jgi:hypothetical protein